MVTPLNTIYLLMRNFIANFVRILEICKDFAGNRVNELGNVPRCGVVPKFSDLEVIALGITAEAFHIDSENYLFYRLSCEAFRTTKRLQNGNKTQSYYSTMFIINKRILLFNDDSFKYRTTYLMNIDSNVVVMWLPVVVG